MTRMAKSRPGDWWLGLGGLGLLGGLIFGGIVLFAHMPEYARFREAGLVTEARISDKDAEVSTSTSGGRRTRERSSTSHFLEVSFSTPGAKPYAQAAAEPAKPALPQTGNPIDRIEFGFSKASQTRGSGPLDGRAELRVSRDAYEKATVGEIVSIVFLKDDSTQAKLTSDVRDYSPALPLALALLTGLVGGAACAVGWRRRKAASNRVG